MKVSLRRVLIKANTRFSLFNKTLLRPSNKVRMISLNLPRTLAPSHPRYGITNHRGGNNRGYKSGQSCSLQCFVLFVVLWVMGLSHLASTAAIGGEKIINDPKMSCNYSWLFFYNTVTGSIQIRFQSFAKACNLQFLKSEKRLKTSSVIVIQKIPHQFFLRCFFFF